MAHHPQLEHPVAHGLRAEGPRRGGRGVLMREAGGVNPVDGKEVLRGAGNRWWGSGEGSDDLDAHVKPVTMYEPNGVGMCSLEPQQLRPQVAAHLMKVQKRYVHRYQAT